MDVMTLRLLQPLLLASLGLVATGIPAAEPRSTRPFAGSLLLTTDEDWRTRWETAAGPELGITETDTLTRGRKLWVVVTIANAGLDARGLAHVACEVRFVKPDGTVAFEDKTLRCYDGPPRPGPGQRLLAQPLIEFVGEPSDPSGTWRVQVRLRDQVRGAELPMTAVFTLR